MTLKSFEQYIEKSDDKLNVKFNFTVDKWGGFEMGDGEFFKNSNEELMNTKPDFFIKTVKNQDTYETTFIPNPFFPKDTSDWTSQEDIELFKYAITYRTTKEQVIERLKKKETFGIWKIEDNKDVIIVDNMFWYYLGLYDTGEEIIKCEPKEHPLYKELESIMQQ